MSDTIIVLLVVGALGIILLLYYNGFIRKRNLIEQAFSSIDVMLKKRCDLVPNLVATVKEYMRHESETFGKITALRAQAMDPKSDSGERLRANNELGRQVRGLMLQVENYPELKASQNFLLLQHSLNEIEEQLAASRRAFNATVNDYNTSIEMFPGNLLARMFSFTRRPLLETDAAERKNIDAGAAFES